MGLVWLAPWLARGVAAPCIDTSDAAGCCCAAGCVAAAACAGRLRGLYLRGWMGDVQAAAKPPCQAWRSTHPGMASLAPNLLPPFKPHPPSLSQAAQRWVFPMRQAHMMVVTYLLRYRCVVPTTMACALAVMRCGRAWGR